MSNRPAFTLSEAAERTGTSRSTMRRYRETGKFPNAYKDTDRQWRVPVEDLLASGLVLSGQAQAEQVSAFSEQGQVAAPEQGERVRELEALLALERARAEGLERVAAAAEANAADLRMALRMIEAVRPERGEQAQPEQVSKPSGQGMSTPPEQGEQGMSTPSEHPASTPRRHWWQWGSS
ncbi:helix-turn-helix domain-containing protein [Arthrobacter echini]|uniref:Helix-turn-helix domain-containing protein n=1 Tax=Arthrobacter echini TaxID=1529066 RepID=A0A4S5DZQ4_9MICC|nr:helix-turn-helix domain-containing protein [Arthrobacter echini]